ncbi:MAG: glycosyltransferase family 4 protein [Planctomycetia bacterium]|jgi:glycosyltransferase involved in cell wall biosynthesis
MKRPRPLILCEHPTLLGGERSLLTAIDQLRNQINPVLLGPSEGPLAEAVCQREIDFLTYDSTDDQGKRLSQELRREQLAQAIRKAQPTIVHANSLSMARLVGPVAQSLGVVSLGHLRDILRLSNQVVDDLNRNTRLLAVSEATRQFHVEQGLDPARTEVLYNGIDLDRFQPRSKSGYLHRELGLSETSHLVVTIGQLGLRKAPDLIPEIAVQVLRQIPETYFLMVGSRWSEKKESRQLEADLKESASRLDGHIRLLGVRSDVDRLLNEVDLLLHPARQEPLGRVLLEAAATGTAVIATDVGGTREIFPPELEAATIVTKDDVDAMAKAIIELLKTPSQREKLAKRARRRAEAQFDAEMAATNLLEHYRST